ncbi:MAG: MTAP family purine nucleoside phosphorylase [candidate division WOR-3 bacterium]
MIGVITGSGISGISGPPERTPFGNTSGPIIQKEIAGQEVLFLGRHGEEHAWLAHRVPHRANIWGLYSKGAKAILSVGSVGGIDPSLSPGDYLVLDDLIDLNPPPTFYDGPGGPEVPESDDPISALINKGVGVHISFTEPFCPALRKILLSVIKEMGLPVRDGGTYIQTRGPRLESPAEIRAFGILGAHVVGMTMASEAVLAKELGICFVGLAVVANMASGIRGARPSGSEVETAMKERAKEIGLLVEEFVARAGAGEREPCECALQPFLGIQSQAWRERLGKA